MDSTADTSIVHADGIRMELRAHPGQGVQEFWGSGYSCRWFKSMFEFQCVMDIVLEWEKYLRAFPMMILFSE